MEAVKKSEIRNSKSETNSNYLDSKLKTVRRSFRPLFDPLNLEIVSNFEFRISDLRPGGHTHPLKFRGHW